MKLNEVVSPDLYISLIYFQILLHSHVHSQTKFQLCRGFLPCYLLQFRDQVSSLNNAYTDHGSKITMHQGYNLLVQARSVKLVFQICCKHRSHTKPVWCLKKNPKMIFKVCTFDALYFIRLSKALLIRMDKHLIMLL